MTRLLKILGSGFLVGYLPLAPATFGSALAAAIYWFLLPSNPLILLSIVGALFLFGTWVSGKLVEVWGEDARRIVIDEICGMFLTMALIPKSLWLLVVGFLLFRLFDIWKPFPIRSSQKLKKGFGVMVDDILAAVYANLVLQLIVFFFPNLRGA